MRIRCWSSDVCSSDLLDALRASHLQTITIVGRRGPHQIMMTPKELSELAHLERASPRVDRDDLPDEAADVLLEPGLRKSVAHLRSFAALPQSRHADQPQELASNRRASWRGSACQTGEYTVVAR